MDQQTQNFLEACKRSLKAHRNFNKVFCIGAHKTGTTSMIAIFNALGLNVAPQHEGELYSEKAMRGDLKGLCGYIEQHDAFQDSPFSNNFVFSNLDALFPDSRFILTVRSPEDWFRSLTNFHAKIFGVPDISHLSREMLEQASYLYPGYLARGTEAMYLIPPPDYRSPTTANARPNWDLLYDKETYIASYEKRNQAIRDYFKLQPEKLLEIDITTEPTTSKIVKFLGLPSWMSISTPKLNAT